MRVHRGEVYFMNLDPVVGREQSGNHPVVVISADELNSLPLVAVVVIGTSGNKVAKDYPTNARIPARESGLPKETVFMGFQIRTVDFSRFPPKLAGRLSKSALEAVEFAVRESLDL